MDKIINKEVNVDEALEALDSLNARTIVGLNKFDNPDARFILLNATENEFKIIKQALLNLQVKLNKMEEL